MVIVDSVRPSTLMKISAIAQVAEDSTTRIEPSVTAPVCCRSGASATNTPAKPNRIAAQRRSRTRSPRNSMARIAVKSGS